MFFSLVVFLIFFSLSAALGGFEHGLYVEKWTPFVKVLLCSLLSDLSLFKASDLLKMFNCGISYCNYLPLLGLH